MLLENGGEVLLGAREPRLREKIIPPDDNMEEAIVEVDNIDIEVEVIVGTESGSQELSRITVAAEVTIVDIEATALDLAIAHRVAIVEIIRRPHPMALTATSADVEVIRGM